MKKLLIVLLLSVFCAPVFAADNCEEIKNQIDTKIKAVGVPVYKLIIADVNATVSGKIVGTCEAGKKKIVYWRQ